MQHLSAEQGSKEIGPDGRVDRDRAILNYIRKSLRATWPWTRLLSVVGVIAAILMPILISMRG